MVVVAALTSMLMLVSIDEPLLMDVDEEGMGGGEEVIAQAAEVKRWHSIWPSRTPGLR